MFTYVHLIDRLIGVLLLTLWYNYQNIIMSLTNYDYMYFSVNLLRSN